MNRKIHAVIIGASGYTGAELIRLLQYHPDVVIKYMVADSNAGKPVAELYPHLSNQNLPDLVKLDEVNFTNVDVAFCCLPHSTSQEIILSLPEHLKIIDLSADFRLNDISIYEEWYNTPHKAPKLQEEAVYGLSEIFADEIKAARLVACPGCYPTSALLPLYPLLESGLINNANIIIDAKSGVTGAGRSAKTANLFGEINESIKAYGIGKHRHMVEIEQALSLANGADIEVTFTPHLIPMSRGILATTYVQMKDGKSVEDLGNCLMETYKNSQFVSIYTDGRILTTRDVSATNNADISIFPDRKAGRAVIISVIDNLVKGASGQAVQNMNIMFGLDESEGLQHVPVFP